MRVRLWKTEAGQLKGHPAGGREWKVHTFVCSLALATTSEVVENGGRRHLQRHLCSARPQRSHHRSVNRRWGHGDACARLLQTRANRSANG